jgi:tetratricopeptide (TPR) repeat protein
MHRSIHSTGYVCLLIGFIALAATAWAGSQHPDPEEVRRAGRVALDAGDYALAERQFRVALEQFEKTGDAAQTAQTLGDLAAVFETTGHYSQSEQILMAALALTPRDPRLISNLGALYVKTARKDQAKAAFKQALQLLPLDDPHTAVLLSNLGTLYTGDRSYRQARKTLERALAIAEKHLPVNDPDFAPILTNLAGLAQRQKKWALAESYLLRAFYIIGTSGNMRQRDRALVLQHLGIVHYQQQKLAQAESELRQALEIETKTFGTETVRTVSIALSLARVLVASRDYDEARTLYTVVLPLQERLLGANTSEVAATLDQFAKLLQSLNQRGPAMEMEARAKRIRAELAYTRSVDVSDRR